jgi:hypothetical protein
MNGSNWNVNDVVKKLHNIEIGGTWTRFNFESLLTFTIFNVNIRYKNKYNVFRLMLKVLHAGYLSLGMVGL